VKGALVYEWRRITSVRSTYWFSGMAIFFSALIAFFIAITFSSSDFTTEGVSNFFQASALVVTAGASVLFVPVLSAPFCAVIGAMSFGHEYRYSIIRQTLTAIPDRVTVFFAKLTVLVAWLLGIMVVTVVINLGLGALLLENFSLHSEAFRPILNYILYNVAWGISGFALAALLRNLAGALVAVLVYPLVVEPIGYNILRIVDVGNLNNLANLFPASAGRRTMYLPYDLFANPITDASVTIHVWGLAASTLVFWIGIIAIVGAAFVLFMKRDA
jgi:ABC-2 type transport system permease protein